MTARPDAFKNAASSPPVIDSWRTPLWLLAFAALAGGLAENGLIFGARIALERYTLLNPQGAWLAPLANLVLLAVPLLVIWVTARRWGAARALTITAFAAAFFAVLEPALVLKERVHPVAIFALAAGIASQVARQGRLRPVFFLRLLRGATVVMLVLSSGWALTFNAVRAVQERRAMSSLGSAPIGAPNVILLVLDTVRAMSLSAYGYERLTSPVLASLAAGGVRFDRAIATAPWTLPTHATLFTGRYPHELSAGWSTPLDQTPATLAEQLGAHGYATAGFAANLRYCSYEFGLSRGFDHYRDYAVSWSEMLRTSALTHELVLRLNPRFGSHFSPGRQSATEVSERMLDWLDSVGDRPFFAFLNFYDAHAPYAPPAPYDTLFSGKEPIARDPGGDLYTPEEVRGLQDSYDASIAYLDAQIGALVAELKRRGALDNTLLIITSDHGEEFNEHGQLNHGNTLYFPALHVPLILVQPKGAQAGTVVSEPVTLRDLPATILEAARIPAPYALPGHSLSRFWTPDAPGGKSPLLADVKFARNLPKSFPISKGDMRSVVVDGFHYIRDGAGAEELYDIRTDPFERHDLAGTPDGAARRDAMRAHADSLLGPPHQPR